MIFPEHRGSPDWADESDGLEFRLRQAYQREADRQERERIQASSRANMARLRDWLDTGDWQAQDPASRALGYGARPRDLLDDLIDQMDDPVTRYEDGQARARAESGRPPLLNTAAKVQDWLSRNGAYHGGPR